jgi:hypothetical protein
MPRPAVAKPADLHCTHVRIADNCHTVGFGQAARLDKLLNNSLLGSSLDSPVEEAGFELVAHFGVTFVQDAMGPSALPECNAIETLEFRAQSYGVARKGPVESRRAWCHGTPPRGSGRQKLTSTGTRYSPSNRNAAPHTR